MIETLIIYFLFPIFIITTALLIWYIRSLLSLMEERSLEITERFQALHTFLEETYKMDLFYGEPRLKELLDIIKDFDSWAGEFENRIIAEEREEIDGTTED